MDATDAELAAIMRVLYLESLYRDASGYHHALRHSDRADDMRLHHVKVRPIPTARPTAGARIPAPGRSDHFSGTSDR
ncbi:hypothetical protein [Kitasatospora sp. NPDC093558]|uniref:hypothetical protein n=1 Tax=Kitasatospora sp. NPDC093558 TaxID=3155201 RepID=UPI003418298D